MQPTRNRYDEFASEYEAMMEKQEKAGVEANPMMSSFLQVVGDVSGLTVLDAGCGEGYLSRILAQRGANVTGIDVSAPLVEIARTKAFADRISYQVADLSQPLAAYQGYFDLVASFFVLNDVYDYRGFLRTLGAALKYGGRLVLFMNSPYSFVMRNFVSDYFASDQAFPYLGMADLGVKVHFYQRTLEEYLDACFAAGFRLQRLVDVRTPEGSFKRRKDSLLPEGHDFPYFTILSFVKVGENI
ncbi:MAG TPA: class I SAM-dependent methyltransferase [Ktedonobacteraceae bacterium]|nr:class I SAM-dependent methyltransferase [Ktedonobacteraceae bacterium]